ncbi:NAD-dependent epimerase/dehydratase family protein [Polaribacter glomeratus]|uniref:UDP-glucose 4-epimerase n=1 Tax=Polaribacter glomeratus TaxID=102 RepID=A0A2S7WU05_9FLAO|nr:NAD(P)-dependent oxidoreductase [Polaribacter glomeratus]PQJ81093.1 UDP-glucose 4-epimerase [Polaribacter glomeratus]TXD65645.1 NAD(P)-dependent oxidoreductase [Polaribacter glomeratus]
MKKVLVFGGFGFLGYYLVKELLSKKYEVTVADIQTNDQLENLVSYHYCDISNEEMVKHVFETDTFDFVYNLAGFANLDRAIKNPLKTIQLNVVGNIHIIDECLKHNIKKFVYASSAYAVSNKGSFYGISKLASEKIIEEYHHKHKLEFVILRYGSVYSERDYDNNYIYNLVKEALLTHKINHKGDGNEIREYIHASDAAKLSVDVIESEYYNNIHVILTGNERMQRKELFQMINEILNNKVEIKCNDTGYANHYKFTPYSFDPSVSKKLIANPHIDMGQGLLECVRAVYNNQNG